MSERFSYEYVVQFGGVTTVRGKIRHAYKNFKIRAENSQAAIDKAHALVQADEKLKALHYPSYAIKSIK